MAATVQKWIKREEVKMNKKPKRFIECLLPVTICNLKCSYCYIIQGNRRDMKKQIYNIHHNISQRHYRQSD